MGKYTHRSLLNNEFIQKEAIISKMFLIGPILLLSLSLIIASLFIAVKVTFALIVSLAFLLPSIIFLVVQIVRISNTEITITNKRFIGKTGFLSIHAADVPLNKIESTSISQSFWGNVFNYGYVCIKTTSSKFLFPAVKYPDKFKHEIMQQIEKREEDKMLLQADMIAAALKGKPYTNTPMQQQNYNTPPYKNVNSNQNMNPYQNSNQYQNFQHHNQQPGGFNNQAQNQQTISQQQYNNTNFNNNFPKQ